MAFIMGRLFLEASTPPRSPNYTRHFRKIICRYCQRAYSLDYSPSSASPETLGKLLEAGQKGVTRQHLSSHRQSPVIIGLAVEVTTSDSHR
jgi:hypothetical protein